MGWTTVTRRSVVLGALACAGYVASAFAVHYGVGYRGFLGLELEHGAREFAQTVAAVRRELRSLDRTCRSWAAWDECRVAYGGAGDEALDDPILARLADYGLDLLQIVELDGEVAAGGARVPGSGRPGPVLGIPAVRYPTTHPLFAGPSRGTPVSGLLRTPDGVLLAAARPIPRSSGEEPGGVLVVGRFLDGGLVRELAAQFGVPVAAEPWSGREGWDDPWLVTADQLTEGAVTARPAGGGRLAVRGVLADVRGDPALRLTLELPRTVVGKGLRVLGLSMAWVLVAGLAGAAFLLGARAAWTRLERRARKIEDDNVALQQLMAESVRSGRDLREAKEEFRELSLALLEAQEREAVRISRDLHDGLGQSLTAIKYRLEGAVGRAAAGPLSAEDVAPALGLLKKVIADVRSMCVALRPPTLDDLGVLETLDWLRSEVETSCPGVRVDFVAAAAEDDIPPRLKTVMYRIAQEAVSNAVRHGKARHVRIEVAKRRGQIELAVSDDGRGFDPVAARQGGRGRGLGLRSMRERAEYTGGGLTLEAEPGGGTRVRAEWPLPPG